MKRIWSPWRMKYIQQPTHNPNCFFCDAVSKPDEPENLVVHRGKKAFVIINRYPYASGHVMVVPDAHVSSLVELDNATRNELINLLAETEVLLKNIYHPEGFNIGANLGSAGGAGVPGHFHFHIVPRWVGDTNFMSALGETRVLPEEIEQTHIRLRDAWK